MSYRLFCLLISGLTLFSCTSNRSGNDGVSDSAAEVSSLTDTRWNLAEVLGVTVEFKDSMREHPFLQLQIDEQNHIFTAYAGCNQIGGSFVRESENNLRFEAIRSTQMFCEEMELEGKLTEALQQTEHFEIINGVMILGRSRMAPLARFEAQN